MPEINIEKITDWLERASPKEILIWAWQVFDGEVAATSSFQTQSVPLLHMIVDAVPKMPVIFLDTGYHFPETLAFRENLVREWNINLRIVKPNSRMDSAIPKKREIYRENPDLCCFINKVKPHQIVMQDYRAWISGIRRDQTVQRRAISIIEQQTENIYKISPLANWLQKDIWNYIHDYDLPTHPLLEKGYLSIGCAPCTRPVAEGDEERAGRWSEHLKTECGLHMPAERVNLKK